MPSPAGRPPAVGVRDFPVPRTLRSFSSPAADTTSRRGGPWEGWTISEGKGWGRWDRTWGLVLACVL